MAGDAATGTAVYGQTRCPDCEPVASDGVDDKVADRTLLDPARPTRTLIYKSIPARLGPSSPRSLAPFLEANR